MARIYIFSKEIVVEKQIETIGDYGEYKFQMVENCLQIKYKDKMYKLQSKCYLELEDTIYFDSNDNRTWYILPLHYPFTFKRNMVLRNKHISFEHFKIDENLQINDLESTNGTYVNGKRIQTKKLKNNDLIQVTSIQMYYFIDCLFIDTCCQGVDAKYIQIVPPSIETPWQPQFKKLKINDDPIFLRVESPQIMTPIRKPSLFQSVGSAALILCSSLCTGLVMIWVQNKTVQEMSTMWMTSGSMCFAFLLYGIINRKNQVKDQKKERDEEANKYKNYLQKCQDRTELLKHDLLEQDRKNYSTILKFDLGTYGSDIPLYIGHCLKSWITIEHQTISYQYEENDLTKKLLSFVQEMNVPIERNIYFQAGKSYWIQSDNQEWIYFLLLQSLWAQKDFTWNIQINNANINPRIFFFEEVNKKNGQILLTDSIQHSKSLIYISRKKVNYDFDYIVQSNKLEIDFDHYFRFILLQRKQERNITFLDTIKDITWSKNVKLKVPVGFNVDQQPIMLDLTEAHGLVAGMTGSGKSEWLSSLLMQLILRNSPETLQYILIDFKGGAFGEIFYEFPHCAGMVTNLETLSMRRFIISLDSEIKSRQLLIKEHIKTSRKAKGNIDDYNLYSKNKMSHLLIIVDEFAQLKTKYPQYMDQLKEIARIGRSLGIHLILSTQKPFGVVDEQIWSNAKWRVCLRVNSEGDSREILKNEKAAHLENVGSFILQIDNENEYSGQGFYLHDKYDEGVSWIDVDTKESYEKTSETILEFLASKVLSENQSRKWVLLPELHEQKINSFALIDIPEHQKQETFDFKVGKKYLCLYDDPSIVSSIIACYQQFPIYIFGSMEFDNYIDDYLYEDTCNIPENSTVIVINHTDIQKLMTKNIRLIVLVNYVDHHIVRFKKQFDQFICFSWHDKDDFRLFLDTFQIDQLPNHYHWYKDVDLHTMYVPKRNPVILERKKYILNEIGTSLFRIGQEILTFRDVYWEKSQNLIICFVQQTVEKKIYDVLNTWKKLDPSLTIALGFDSKTDICVVDCIENRDIFNDASFLAKQYDIDILWVGLGFQDYSYILKRNYPTDIVSDILYWKKGKCIQIIDE